MTTISSSRLDSTQKRRFMRRHRRVKLFQALWQSIALLSLSGGLVWGTTRPIWVIRESSQVVVSGNRLLSAKAISSLLPLSYPQSLLKIEPAAIARSLKAQPAIADAIVTRQLFPPGINIQVKERVPVALTLNQTSLHSAPIRLSGPQLTPTTMGLLDETGVWMPLSSYLSLYSNPKLPKLKVFGSPEHYQSYWVQLYQAVIHSPIKISEVNCQDPANLILGTELGTVYLGPYSPQINEQINTLAQMRKLSAQVDLRQISYINLRSLKSPSIQMKPIDQPIKGNIPIVKTKFDHHP